MRIYSVLLVAFVLYTGFVYTKGTEITESNLNQELITSGRKIFQSKNCIACHQLYGLGGHLGPDLTNVISKPKRGEQYVRAVLKSGIGAMPAFNLSENDTLALLEFLKHIDSTGESPPKSFKITPWGSISLNTKEEKL